MEEQQNTLKMIDLVELMQQPFDHASYESGYRSGYRDGWIQCVDALAKALSSDAYETAFHFWEDELRQWKFQEQGTRFPPPELVYKSERKVTARTLSPALRFTILKRDNYRCQLCGASPQDGLHVRLEVDHKIARAKNGSHDPNNLWVLCFECNNGKRTQEL